MAYLENGTDISSWLTHYPTEQTHPTPNFFVINIFSTE